MEKEKILQPNCANEKQVKGQTKVKNHPKSATKFKCNVCDKPFSTRGNLTRHMKQFHAVINNETEAKTEKNFCCETCGEKFSFKGNLTRHKVNKHTKKDDAVNVQESHAIINNGTKVKVEKKYCCDVCSLKFTSKGNLARHIKEKHFNNNADVIECPSCKDSFTRRDNLYKHIDLKHLGECQTCLE